MELDPLYCDVTGQPDPEPECDDANDADGTINLVHYAAWLVREMASRD
jgi:hypothetical protein